MVYTYKYEDGKDFVTVIIKVNDDFGDETLTHERYYYLYYDDIESQANLDDDIEVKLPWDSNSEQ